MARYQTTHNSAHRTGQASIKTIFVSDPKNPGTSHTVRLTRQATTAEDLLQAIKTQTQLPVNNVFLSGNAARGGRPDLALTFFTVHDQGRYQLKPVDHSKGLVASKRAARAALLDSIAESWGRPSPVDIIPYEIPHTEPKTWNEDFIQALRKLSVAPYDVFTHAEIVGFIREARKARINEAAKRNGGKKMTESPLYVGDLHLAARFCGRRLQEQKREAMIFVEGLKEGIEGVEKEMSEVQGE
ncbi:hypothetical protein M011DRAFT_468408 [Sporormia fimetaria CBS 119925]|uniref:Uncharacterized protein n=1 Tax=Sporormia fimetaria CBS 119925 TaxID=1340428 RepID=A0A6A6VAI4_9PLEO|nr:hypothetical protein M011DRAFT_468408 [Sporormia fimetaria CBS 119925]